MTMNLRDYLRNILVDEFFNNYEAAISRILSIPIIVECEEYNGTDTECDTQPCPHCIDGQRTLMKVRDVRPGKYGHMASIGQIIEPLTLGRVGG